MLGELSEWAKRDCYADGIRAGRGEERPYGRCSCVMQSIIIYMAIGDNNYLLRFIQIVSDI